MTTRTADAPRLFYALALLVGFCGLPLSFAVLSFGHGGVRGAATAFPAMILGGQSLGAWLVGVAAFGAPQWLLAALFGYAWPRVGWRWGVWLTALPLCVLTLFAPAVGFFLPAAALSALPAFAGAHAGARLCRRRGRVI